MAGPQFAADLDESGAWVVVHIEGEIDVATAPDLRQALELAIAKGNRVIADLSEVTFLDSSGLGVLVQAHRQIAAAEGRFQVVVTQPNVHKVLEITGLLDVLSVHDAIDTTLA